MCTKILLADDHEITRDGLKALIENQPGMKVVGEAENGRKAVELARKFKPDVIIMDISMPDLNGIDATRQILSEEPDIKVIALSMYSDRRYITGMLKAGVSAYLLKNCAFDELVRAITCVKNNQTYMSHRIADTVVKEYKDYLTNSETSPFESLTDREREVLQLIAEGVKTNNIAERLHVSVKTISTHRQQIMKKLNLYSVAELTLFALREGLIFLNAEIEKTTE